MNPQITEATRESTFEVLNRDTNAWGIDQVTVKGPYRTGTYDLVGHHNNCEYGGMKFVSRDEWANNYYCTGCNWSAYYPLGD